MKGLYIALLVLWLGGGTYIANKKYCQKSKAKKPVASSVAATGASNCDKTISFDSGDFSISSEDNFTFKIHKSDMVRPSEKLDEFLGEISTYLSDNPETTVLVTGQYSSNEKKPSGAENLGLARATTVSYTHLTLPTILRV